jgi:hypothetical protein
MSKAADVLALNVTEMATFYSVDGQDLGLRFKRPDGSFVAVRLPHDALPDLARLIESAERELAKRRGQGLAPPAFDLAACPPDKCFKT